MKDEISSLGSIFDFSEAELDLLSSALRTLMGRGFIIRGIAREGELYDFAIRNGPVIESWLACMGASLRRDEVSGVIAFIGGNETRMRLSRDETCALLVFRLLYDERLADLRLASFPSASVFDFSQKYRAITDMELKKTRMTEVLRRMAGFKLIELVGDPTDPECPIVLYPSLALALDRGAIDELLVAVRARNEDGKEPGSDSGTEEEDP